MTTTAGTRLLAPAPTAAEQEQAVGGGWVLTVVWHPGKQSSRLEGDKAGWTGTAVPAAVWHSGRQSSGIEGSKATLDEHGGNINGSGAAAHETLTLVAKLA